jgi:hypothetical protein
MLAGLEQGNGREMSEARIVGRSPRGNKYRP